MKHLLVLIALCATPAAAAPGGYLHVLLKGYWVCETQGDATSAPVKQLQDSFRVIADSSYRTTRNETGTYLLLGTEMAMTGGPFNGRRYHLAGQGILHLLDAKGQSTNGRCVRQASASSLDDDAE